MNDSTNDKRQEFRLDANETVFIEISSDPSEDQATILISRSLDLSANGLQLMLDRPLIHGAIHQIGIQLKQPNTRFSLAAEVMWCRPSGDHHAVGLSLFDSLGTDIQKWKEIVAERCS